MKQTVPCSSRGIVILQVWELILRSWRGGGAGGKELRALVKLDTFEVSARSTL